MSIVSAHPIIAITIRLRQFLTLSGLPNFCQSWLKVHGVFRGGRTW
jgi:hypothetical protein